MKKTIGLIVAMDKELSLFIDNNPLVSIENKRGCFDFYITNVNDNVLVIAKSGIGKVNSALCVATMINEYHPDYIISSGVCGTLRKQDVLPGDFVIAEEIRYHDVWCGKPNLLGQVQDMPASYYCEHIDLNKLPDKYKYHRGLMISGDWFVDDSEKALSLSSFDSNGIDMESGSIAQTCYRYEVPLISVRIVSDAILNPETKPYDEFWNAAPTMLNDVVMCVVENYLKEMNKTDAIDVLKLFVDHEKHSEFYANATREEVDAIEFAIKYMEEH